MLRIAIGTALLWIAATTASADEPRVKVASCNKVGTGVCFEYRNETTGALKFNEAACDKRQGHVWSESEPCPTEKRIAHCKREMLDSVTQANFYPPATLKKAEEDCAAMVMKVELN